MTLINISGKIFPPEQAMISVFDHGFLFGDSVYEVLITHKGRLFTVKEHLRRLMNSARAINLKIPFSSEAISREIEKTLKAAGNKDSYIRIIVTRGKGEINIDPSSCQKPELIIIVKEFNGYPESLYQKGLRLSIVSTRRNFPQSVNPAIKTGNYLNSILAIIEAKKKGFDDALMLNYAGIISESTTSNFFIVRDGLLQTPSLDCGILEGVTRGLILKIARENKIPLREGYIRPEEIKGCTEAFISSTTRGIVPISQCDKIKINKGKPGPVTTKFIDLYRKKLDQISH